MVIVNTSINKINHLCHFVEWMWHRRTSQ